ncbi:hypothetical protein ASE34_08495 [Microbacterium sp. Root280D1]|nr:hypothetical protein ASE34_08495 [Microbacterium sp. Root280D1]
MPVIAGGFLILGGLFGFVSNWLLENRKQTRAEAIRWDGDIREYVAEIIDLCRQITLVVLSELAFAAGAEYSIRTVVEALPPDEQKKLLNGEDLDTYARREATDISDESPEQTQWREKRFDLYQQVDKLVASLDLVAPDAIREAARRLRQITADLRTQDTASPPKRKDTAHIDEAVEELITAVRRHLGRAS